MVTATLWIYKDDNREAGGFKNGGPLWINKSIANIALDRIMRSVTYVLWNTRLAHCRMATNPHNGCLYSKPLSRERECQKKARQQSHCSSWQQLQRLEKTSLRPMSQLLLLQYKAKSASIYPLILSLGPK